ncbi:Uncharacterised protein [uncultured archaeon]|nr:Uncharacterised protein [uncultured archaeon]
MNKKGAEFAINTVIMIVLGLIVLVILILVVRQQVTKGASQYTQIGEQATATGGCASFLEGRSCVKGTACPPPPDMLTVPGTWPDCQAKAQKENTPYTCCKTKS